MLTSLRQSPSLFCQFSRRYEPVWHLLAYSIKVYNVIQLNRYYSSICCCKRNWSRKKTMYKGNLHPKSLGSSCKIHSKVQDCPVDNSSYPNDHSTPRKCIPPRHSSNKGLPSLKNPDSQYSVTRMFQRWNFFFPDLLQTLCSDQSTWRRSFGRGPAARWLGSPWRRSVRERRLSNPRGPIGRKPTIGLRPSGDQRKRGIGWAGISEVGSGERPADRREISCGFWELRERERDIWFGKEIGNLTYNPLQLIIDDTWFWVERSTGNVSCNPLIFLNI